jgi:hypothetical protein
MHKQSTGRVRRDGKQWSEILRRLKSSELETKEFCRREGVALWRRRLGSVDSADFVELVPSSNPDAPSSKWSLEVSLPNGASLRFQG